MIAAAAAWCITTSGVRARRVQAGGQRWGSGVVARSRPAATGEHGRLRGPAIAIAAAARRRVLIVCPRRGSKTCSHDGEHRRLAVGRLLSSLAGSAIHSHQPMPEVHERSTVALDREHQRSSAARRTANSTARPEALRLVKRHAGQRPARDQSLPLGEGPQGDWSLVIRAGIEEQRQPRTTTAPAFPTARDERQDRRRGQAGEHPAR